MTPSPPFKYNTSPRDNYIVTYENLQNLKYDEIKNQWKMIYKKVTIVSEVSSFVGNPLSM